jgi:phage-related protein
LFSLKVVFKYNFCIFAMKRRILAFKDYYSKFMKGRNLHEQMKIKRALLLLECSDLIPAHYMKYVKEGIYELRVSAENKEFRFFYLCSGDDLILLNAYTKKTQKIPKREIVKAERLKKEYYETDR